MLMFYNMSEIKRCCKVAEPIIIAQQAERHALRNFVYRKMPELEPRPVLDVVVGCSETHAQRHSPHWPALTSRASTVIASE